MNCDNIKLPNEFNLNVNVDNIMDSVYKVKTNEKGKEYKEFYYYDILSANKKLGSVYMYHSKLTRTWGYTIYNKNDQKQQMSLTSTLNGSTFYDCNNHKIAYLKYTTGLRSLSRIPLLWRPRLYIDDKLVAKTKIRKVKDKRGKKYAVIELRSAKDNTKIARAFLSSDNYIVNIKIYEEPSGSLLKVDPLISALLLIYTAEYINTSIILNILNIKNVGTLLSVIDTLFSGFKTFEYPRSSRELTASINQ